MSLQKEHYAPCLQKLSFFALDPDKIIYESESKVKFFLIICKKSGARKTFLPYLQNFNILSLKIAGFFTFFVKLLSIFGSAKIFASQTQNRLDIYVSVHIYKKMQGAIKREVGLILIKCGVWSHVSRGWSLKHDQRFQTERSRYFGGRPVWTIFYS